MHSPIRLLAIVLVWSSPFATLAAASRVAANVAHPPAHALEQRQASSSTTSASGSGLTTSGSSTSSASTNIGSPSVTTTSSANWPTLSGYPTCVTNCLQIAVSNANCSSVVDVDCYCNSTAFESSLVSCTSQQCYSNVSSAESLAQQFCNRAAYNVTIPASGTYSATLSTSASPSLSFPSATPPSTTSSASMTGNSASSGDPSPTSLTGGAVALTRDMAGLGMSVGVALLGVLGGAALL